MRGETDRRGGPSRAEGGFTLVELLAVIGVMAVVLAALSFSFRGGDQSLALKNAQAVCSSMVSAARAKAALTGRDARLIVVGDTGFPVDYLRRLQVIHQAEDGSWQVSATSALLPKDVAIVPPGVVPVIDGVSWTDVEQSLFSNSSEVVQVTLNGSPVDCWYVAFSSRGTVVGAGIQIVLSSVRSEVTGPAFENPLNLRGLKVSNYGVQTLISDPEGFPD